MFKKKRKKIPFCIVLVISSELFIIRSRTQRTVSYLLLLSSPPSSSKDMIIHYSKKFKGGKIGCLPFIAIRLQFMSGLLPKLLGGVC